MKKIIAMLLMAAMMLSIVPMASFAAEEQTPTPYAYSFAALQSEPLSMGGETYDDAIMFTMGYTGNGATANTGVIAYNFKGQYQSLSFDACYVKGDDRDATFTVIADGTVVMADVPVSYTDIPRRHTVDLTGVSKLEISFYSGGYDKAYYAIGNIVAEPVSQVPSNDTRVSCWDFDARRYVQSRTVVMNEVFEMGGYRYENGYRMTAGYNGTSTGSVPKVGFNFKGLYNSMSFDIGRYMNKASATDLRSSYLTIEVDGVVLDEYNNRKMLWNDIPVHVDLDLTGVSQVLISLKAEGYDSLYYVICDVQLDHDHVAETVPGTDATCTESGLTDGQKCSVCGETLVEQETIEATGHTYTDKKDTTCDVCGYVREIEIASVPMYRMYDPNSGEHFYTGAELERDFLVEAGWHYEGVGFNFPEEGEPVYRLYEPVYGEHLYTMDEAEVDKLVGWGWNVEGVAFNSAGTDEVPQYRLHNPNAKRGGYHFTGSEAEKDFLVSIGWIDEGIGWYSCAE